MGNQPSTEQPRRAAQKLSKPRVGNYVSGNGYTNDHLKAARTNVSVNSSHTNSYPVGTPLSVPQDMAATSHSGVNHLGDESKSAEERADPIDQDAQPRAINRLSGLIRSVSRKSETERMAHDVSTGDTTSNGLARTMSAGQTVAEALLPVQ